MKKPTRKPSKPYYEARELLAELYGIGDDYETPPYAVDAAAFAAAVDDNEGE